MIETLKGKVAKLSHANEMWKEKNLILVAENRTLKDILKTRPPTVVDASTERHRVTYIDADGGTVVSHHSTLPTEVHYDDEMYAGVVSHPDVEQNILQAQVQERELKSKKSAAVLNIDKASIGKTDYVDFMPYGYVDTRLRMGSERTLGSTEIFYPFSWDGKFLGFADIRLTAATDSSIEGNVGIGVRRLNDAHTGIWGVYGYLDHRKTEYDNQFTQMTVGTEWLAEGWEARANSYLPLSGNKTAVESAPTTFSLSGTGLIATGGNNIITEVPNYGFDLELGKKLPLPEYNYLKNVWGYIGGYHFFSDETPSIDGYRLRAKADVTDKLSIGAEWRQDNIRNDEFLVEARLRFPFGGKDKRTQEASKPLYRKLLQQPVRDVDIVVQGSVQTATSSSNVINTDTGNQQRILTVSNAAAGGGDGSVQNPYNTLAAAQAAAAPGDIIYVAYGDGTSTGMNSGLTLNAAGQSLIGSGAALVYDSSRMNLGGGGFVIPDGTVILSKGLSPVLTNVAVNSDILTITADDVLVQGLTLDSANRHGVAISVSGGGNDINGTILRDLNIVTPVGNGVNVASSTSATIDGLTLDRVTIDNSGAIGVALAANSSSTISNFSVTDSTFNQSHTNGLQMTSSGGGDIVSPTIRDTRFVSPGDYGIYTQTTGAGSTQSNLLIDGVTISDAGSRGIYMLGQNTGQITNPTISNTTISSAGDNGIYVLLQNSGTGLDGLTVSDSNISGSALNGIYVQTAAGMSVTNSTFSNLVLDDNHDYGFNLLSSGAGTIFDQVSLANVTTKNSGIDGLFLQASGGGQMTNVAIDDLISTGNAGNGLQIYATGSTATIDNVTVNNTQISDSGVAGAYIRSASTGQVLNLTFAGLKIVDSSDNGMLVAATTSGSLIDNLDISDLEITDSGLLGLGIAATTAAQITNTNIDNLAIQNSGTNGLQINTSGTTATIDDLTVSNVTIDDSGASGIFVQSASSGVITNLNFAGLNVTDSSDYGVYFSSQNAGSAISNFVLDDTTVNDSRNNSGAIFYARSGSSITNGTITNLDVDGAGDRGLYLLSDAGGTVFDNLSISNVTVNDAANDGFRAYVSNGASLTNIALSSAAITNSGENGIYLQTTTAGSDMSGVLLSDVSVSGSATTGIYIQGSSSGALSVDLANVTSTANYDYGVYVNDDTTSSFVVDLGGGTLTSVGGNRIFNNYLQEVRLDYDGANMSAQNNWWGNTAGLLAGEQTLEVGSTIDTTGFLTSDPGP